MANPYPYANQAAQAVFGGGTLGMINPPAEQMRQDSLAYVIQRMESAGGSLFELNNRLESIASQVCGPQPQAISTNAEKSLAPAPQGMIVQAHQMATNIDNGLHRLHELIERIERQL